MFSGLDWPRLYIGFPEVVGDNAVRPYDPKCVGKDEYRKFVCEKYQYRYVGCTGTSIRFAKPDSMMRTVVEMCGKDPDTATAAEMDALDVRLITRSEIKNWRSAMHYATIVNVAPEWRLATAKELEDVKAKELKALRTKKVWTCSKCEQPCTPTTRDRIEEHLDSACVQHFRSSSSAPWPSCLHPSGMVYVWRMSRKKTYNITGSSLRTR
ncbi:hypothetical protein C8Q72DRAFT_552355 [Fomitopsis betulina]|nr:hypothetical protein C8Q72DRAFT_552355 [Fomitopsis betulina]